MIGIYCRNNTAMTTMHAKESVGWGGGAGGGKLCANFFSEWKGGEESVEQFELTKWEESVTVS